MRFLTNARFWCLQANRVPLSVTDHEDGNSGTGGLEVADAVSEFAPFLGQLEGLALSLVEAPVPVVRQIGRSCWATRTGRPGG